MIWDLHNHLSGVFGQTPDERMARLIEYADRMGIARLCVNHQLARISGSYQSRDREGAVEFFVSLKFHRSRMVAALMASQ